MLVSIRDFLPIQVNSLSVSSRHRLLLLLRTMALPSTTPVIARLRRPTIIPPLDLMTILHHVSRPLQILNGRHSIPHPLGPPVLRPGTTMHPTHPTPLPNPATI